MEIIFLSIGVIADSIAIILLWVSHVRGNRWGKGVWKYDKSSDRFVGLSDLEDLI